MTRRVAAWLALWAACCAGSPGIAHAEAPTAALARAVAEAERALDLDEPDLAESRLRSALFEGWMLVGRAEMALADASFDDDSEDHRSAAEKAFGQASSSAVAHGRALFRLALVKLRRGDQQAAIRLLRKLIAQNPADGRARRLLSQALVAGENIGAAIQELEEGFDAAPDDLETGFALATGYLRMGKIEPAEQLFNLVLESRPLPQTHVLVGRTYRDFERYDSARSALEAALAMDPEVRRARYYLGTLTLLEIGMDGLEQAIELFEGEHKLTPDDTLTNLYLGAALVESRLFERALPLLETVVDWPPAAFDAERYLGRCLVGLGRHEEASVYLHRALEKSDNGSGRDLSEIHYQLGIITRSMGEMDVAKEHFALAKRLGIELAEQHREEFASFLRDELGRSRTGSHAGSDFVDPFDIGDPAFDNLAPPQLEDFRQDVLSQLARASMNLGVLKARDQQMARAATYFEQASNLDPGLSDLQRSLGMAHFHAGQFRQAAAPLARALEQSTAPRPQRDALRRALAVSSLNIEDYEQTVRLLRDDPDRATTPAVQFTYALALVRSGHAADAAPIFDQLLAAGDAWPALHVLLGQAKAQGGDFEAAEESLRHALSLDPKIAEANSTLGDLFMRQGRLDEAEQALNAELAAHPDDQRARYLLATILDLHRKPEEAEAQLRKLLDGQPSHGGARYLLGKILLASGDAASALEQLEAAVEIAPDDANVHYQLGLAYQRSGRADEARRHFALFKDLKAATRETPS